MQVKIGMFKDIRKNPYSYLLLFPAVAYTFIFGYMTLPYILIAFQRFNYRTGIFSSAWVGFDNFKFFFASDYALTVTVNTVKINFLSIVGIHLCAIAFAVFLNEIKNKYFQKISQSTFIFPFFLSWIIVSYIVYNIFSAEFGIANQVLRAFHLDPVIWYSTSGPWTWILVLIKIWKEVGINMIIYLAAIVGIDQSMYEASEIDGATRWQQIRRITVPLLMPTATILVLLSIGRIFYGDFAMIYSIVRDNGALFPTTDVIDTYVFRALRKTGDPSWAAAAGLYQSVMGFLFVFGSNWIARKYNRESALF